MTTNPSTPSLCGTCGHAVHDGNACPVLVDINADEPLCDCREFGFTPSAPPSEGAPRTVKFCGRCSERELFADGTCDVCDAGTPPEEGSSPQEHHANICTHPLHRSDDGRWDSCDVCGADFPAATIVNTSVAPQAEARATPERPLNPSAAALWDQPVEATERGILTRWAEKVVEGTAARPTEDRQSHARSILRYEGALTASESRVAALEDENARLREYRVIVGPYLFHVSNFIDSEGPSMVTSRPVDSPRWKRWHVLVNETRDTLTKLRATAGTEGHANG